MISEVEIKEATIVKTGYLTRTALLIALLIAVQYVTGAAGQLVTGSCVNLILAVAAALCPLPWALTVALVSPVCAFLLGIGTPLLQIVPAIMLGNAVYAALLRRLGKRLAFRGGKVAAVIAASCAKCLILWGTVTGLLLPMMALPDAKAAALAASFSWSQLITAAVGGILSLPVIRILKKAIKK